MIKTVKFITILTILLLISCGRMSNQEIKKSWWLYGSGCHIGDALRFDDSNLKGDTIYREDEPIAIVISCKKGIRPMAILEIKDIKSGKVGEYHEKGHR